jgi:hypothetical protein
MPGGTGAITDFPRGPNAGLYYYDGHGAMRPTRQNFPVAAVPSFTDLR